MIASQIFTLGELKEFWDNHDVEEWGYLGTENPPDNTPLFVSNKSGETYVVDRVYDDGIASTFLESVEPEDLKPEWLEGLEDENEL
jgi:hypothetical protein